MRTTESKTLAQSLALPLGALLCTGLTWLTFLALNFVIDRIYSPRLSSSFSMLTPATRQALIRNAFGEGSAKQVSTDESKEISSDQGPKPPAPSDVPSVQKRLDVVSVVGRGIDELSTGRFDDWRKLLQESKFKQGRNPYENCKAFVFQVPYRVPSQVTNTDGKVTYVQSDLIRVLHVQFVAENEWKLNITTKDSESLNSQAPNTYEGNEVAILLTEELIIGTDELKSLADTSGELDNGVDIDVKQNAGVLLSQARDSIKGAWRYEKLLNAISTAASDFILDSTVTVAMGAGADVVEPCTVDGDNLVIQYKNLKILIPFTPMTWGSELGPGQRALEHFRRADLNLVDSFLFAVSDEGSEADNENNKYPSNDTVVLAWFDLRSQKDSQFRFLTTIEKSSSWFGGSAITGKYSVIRHDKNQTVEIQPHGMHELVLFRQSPSIFGWRPCSSNVTVDMLAEQFFPVCERTARSLGRDGEEAGFRSPKLEDVEAIRVWMAAAVQKHMEDVHGSALESYVAVSRRFNGGSYWGGAIQFAIVLCFWLLLLQQVVPNVFALKERDTNWESTAIPLLGFLGTVVGISNALIGAGGILSDDISTKQLVVSNMVQQLATAFDTTFVALIAQLLLLLIMRQSEQDSVCISSSPPSAETPLAGQA